MIFGQLQCYQDQILQHSSSLSFFFDIEHSFYHHPSIFSSSFFSQNSFEQDQINFTHQISLDLTNFQPENSRLHALNTHTRSKLEVQREKKSTLGQCLFSRIIIRAQAGKKLRLESIDQANWSQMAQYYVLPFAICLLPIRCLQIDGYSM